MVFLGGVMEKCPKSFMHLRDANAHVSQFVGGNSHGSEFSGQIQRSTTVGNENISGKTRDSAVDSGRYFGYFGHSSGQDNPLLNPPSSRATKADANAWNNTNGKSALKSPWIVRLMPAPNTAQLNWPNNERQENYVSNALKDCSSSCAQVLYSGGVNGGGENKSVDLMKVPPVPLPRVDLLMPEEGSMWKSTKKEVNALHHHPHRKEVSLQGCDSNNRHLPKALTGFGSLQIRSDLVKPLYATTGLRTHPLWSGTNLSALIKVDASSPYLSWWKEHGRQGKKEALEPPPPCFSVSEDTCEWNQGKRDDVERMGGWISLPHEASRDRGGNSKVQERSVSDCYKDGYANLLPEVKKSVCFPFERSAYFGGNGTKGDPSGRYNPPLQSTLERHPCQSLSQQCPPAMVGTLEAIPKYNPFSLDLNNGPNKEVDGKMIEPCSSSQPWLHVNEDSSLKLNSMPLFLPREEKYGAPSIIQIADKLIERENFDLNQEPATSSSNANQIWVGSSSYCSSRTWAAKDNPHRLSHSQNSESVFLQNPSKFAIMGDCKADFRKLPNFQAQGLPLLPKGQSITQEMERKCLKTGSFLPFPSDNYKGYSSLFQSSHYKAMGSTPSFKAIGKARNDFNGEEKLPSQGYTPRGRRLVMQSEVAQSYLGKRKLDSATIFCKHSQSESRGGGGVTPTEEAEAEAEAKAEAKAEDKAKEEEEEKEEHIRPFFLSKSSFKWNKFPSVMRCGRNHFGRTADIVESKSGYCREPRNFNFVRHILTPSAAAMAIIGTTAKHFQGGKWEGRRGGLFGSWPSPPAYPHPQQEMLKNTAIKASQPKKSIGFTLPPSTTENSKVES